MKTDTTVVSFPHPEAFDDPLTSVLREGARRLLAQAVEVEAEAFLASMADERLAEGRARIVRHGHGPEREIRDAPDRATAEAAMAIFVDKYEVKYPKAVDCLTKDRETLLTFFDFPAEHWDHLRTSNPIESVFATVRHRTVRTKGSLSHKTARRMVFKLVMAAAKSWRRLKGENQLPMVIAGVKFPDGVAVMTTPDQRAA